MAEERFEIVPRGEEAPTTYTEKQFSVEDAVGGLAGGLGNTILGVFSLIGKVIGGIIMAPVALIGGIIDAAKSITGGIAKAIRGEGAAVNEITGAVNDRLGPLDNAITESGDKILELSGKIDAQGEVQNSLVEQQQDLNVVAQDALGRAQLLIGPDGKPVGDYHQLHLDATKANTVAAKASADFQVAQLRINDMVQEQIWTHQDMIELLDIRAPKSWGYRYGQFDGGVWEVCPWRFSSSGQPETYWKYDSPYFTMYARNWNDFGDVFIGFKGSWEGTFDIEINWTNGAIDNWSRPVENTKGYRVWAFRGGAVHINMRSIQVTIFPSSLNRYAYVSNDNGWYIGSDLNSLVRAIGPNREWIRFKNSVTITDNNSQGVMVRNPDGSKRRASASEFLSGVRIYAEDNSAGTYRAQERTDMDVSTNFTGPPATINGNTNNITLVNV